MSSQATETELLRAEIAAAAARMIAEDGADYGAAKRRAARQILGDVRVRGDILPDNAQIEDEVRVYNDLFFSETQPARLLHLRTLAIQLMEELAEFSPYLTGAVLNGTAGDQSDIHLQLFVENAKDVAVFLMNRNIQFEVSESVHFHKRGEPVETLSFLRGNDGVHLALYDYNDRRAARKPIDPDRPERANLDAVRALLEKTAK